MAEQLINLFKTTVGIGGYTSGSGVLNLVSASGLTAVCSVTIFDQTTKVPKVVLTVSVIVTNACTVVAEGADASAVAGDIVVCTTTARSLAAYVAQHGLIGSVNFSSTGGSISNKVVAGVVANVTRSSTGTFVVTFTANQSNYIVSCIANDLGATVNTVWRFTGSDQTPPVAGFTIVTVNPGVGNVDPDLVMIGVFKM